VIRAALAALVSIALCACASAPLNVPSRPSALLQKIVVDNAVSMLGQPYRFGGDAAGGFDCSGLVVYAAAAAGIRVPRTAADQWAGGPAGARGGPAGGGPRPAPHPGAGATAVPRGGVQAGDLIFMHLAHKELHVGIAVGNERFIHAPSTGGYVRIDSLAAAPYAKGFIGARRIIAAP
jgi:cell wall-associated NlpC family hydrolase